MKNKNRKTRHGYAISMSYKKPKLYNPGDIIVKGDCCYHCLKPIEEWSEFVWVSEGLYWVVYHPSCKPSNATAYGRGHHSNVSSFNGLSLDVTNSDE